MVQRAGDQPRAADATVTTTAAPQRVTARVPWGARVRFWIHRKRIALAVRLVAKIDGFVVSHSAYQAALDRMAQLSEWGGQVGLSRRLDKAHESHVEDITRLLVLAAELGDPALQLEGLQERFVNIRLRAMSKRRRQRIQYEAALQALEARMDGKSDEFDSGAVPQPTSAPAVPGGAAAVTPEPEPALVEV